MAYVDGYVITIPKAKLGDYRKMAELGGRIWTKHGALAYYECAGDDLAPASGEHEEEFGRMKPFAELADAGPEDDVVFSFIIFRDRAHRDEVNKLVMEDPEMNDPSFDPSQMPFEMSRMSYGGFAPFVSYGPGA